jgi:hypothetical protein
MGLARKWATRKERKEGLDTVRGHCLMGADVGTCCQQGIKDGVPAQQRGIKGLEVVGALLRGRGYRSRIAADDCLGPGVQDGAGQASRHDG